jgi:type I restriction enzyme, R subunit
METGVNEYLPIIDVPGTDDKKVEAALEHFRDEEVRHNFYHFYRELSELYEILSPDPFLRPYIEQYGSISWLYGVVRANYEPGISIDRSFLRKTADLVQKHTTTDGIGETGTIYEIGEETLEAIIASDKPDTNKVFNLLKKIHDLVEEEGAKQPHLIAIGERAEKIAEAFKSRQMSTQDALEEIIELVRQKKDAVETRDRHGFTAEGQGVYWLLQHQGTGQEESVQVAKETSDVFEQYPHWRTSRDQEQKIRVELYKSLHKAGVKDLTSVGKQLMDVLRRALS